jgi:ADP-dependent NAD(P)H-hydrate dehydratase / NAD(P)H-hydrate epimerase
VRPVLTPAQSGELDRQSERRGIRVEALMETAGRAVARAAVRTAGGAYGRRAVVVCGKGNNGGDGLVAARWLHRWGMGVTVVLLADPAGFREPSATNHRRVAELGLRVLPFSRDAAARELGRADVAIDAIFGTGFRGAPENAPLQAIDVLNEASVPVIAVDIPSGVNGETGAVNATAVAAAVTVTFGGTKPGLLLHPGAALAGEVEVADIGFPPDLIRSDLLLIEEDDVRTLIPVRPASAHKRSAGVVMVIGGSRLMTGAPVLVARAAYRAGAGLVSVGGPRSAIPIVQGQVPEATFVSLLETDGGGVALGAVNDLIDRLPGFDAVAVGPGLTSAEPTADFVRELVRSCPIPMVLDADALNAFAGRAVELAERRSDAVLTPHARELGRLAGVEPDEAASDRIPHARKLATGSGAVVVAKGNPTVTASPSGEARINSTGGPALATAGTGDVLAGVIAALLARRLSPFDAATVGVFVHGLAGDLAGAERGEGSTASDVIDRLPAAIRKVGR